MILVPHSVRGTHTLKHMTEFLVLETRIFLHSENMCYQHILIELLVVLILLESHVHISVSRPWLRHARRRGQLGAGDLLRRT